jgi:queuine/archaeosine tRNA-ribosyltransferase
MDEAPRVWLGQSADTSSICSTHAELSKAPFLVSLGCIIRRPSLRRTHFNSALRSKLGVHGPLMIDSGGFALSMRPQSDWTVERMAECMQDLDAEIFVSLDLPPHVTDSCRERKRKIFASMDNYKELADRFPHRNVMPVVHGRTMPEIEMSLRLLSASAENPAWIGLGGIVPLLQQRALSAEIKSYGGPEIFIGGALSIIRREYPSASVHVFGTGGTRTFPAIYAFGADSADSIGWRQAAGFGSIFLPLKSQRVVTWNNGTRAPRQRLAPSDLVDLEKCLCPICSSQRSIEAKVSLLRAHFSNRSIHNAWTIINQTVAWPRGRSGMISRVAEGLLGPQWARAATRFG